MTAVVYRARSLAALALTLAVMLGAGLGVAARPVSAAEVSPGPWTGSVELYVEGSFTTQKTLLWCTAASIQILRNIVDDEDDHSRRSQRRYFEWMRERNRYDLPLSAGIDPRGWTAGLREFVDDRYRLVASKTFDEALASAVTNLRATNLPVAITVARGNHAWLLTGFSATADPLDGPDFRVTSVRVTGPLYGRQSRNGYDMPPDTSLTPKQLRAFFTPWWYAPVRMAWDGRFVSIQPIPVAPVAVASQPTPSPVPARMPAVSSPAPTVAPAPIGPVAPPARSPTPTDADRAAAGYGGSADGEVWSPAAVGSVGLETVVGSIVLVGLFAAGSLALWRGRVMGRARPDGSRPPRTSQRR